MTEVPPEAEAQEMLTTAHIEVKKIDPKRLNLRDELISLNRCAKVVKGGRRFSFAALVAVGDDNGHVGIGSGKANEAPDAVAKATEQAKRNLIRVPLMGRTIPHEIVGRHDSARVLLKPASVGTGLIAGAAIRKYLALAGVHDILAKSLGSDNVINVLKATVNGLESLKRVDVIARLRGKKVESLIGSKKAKIYEDSRTAILSISDPEAAKKIASEKAEQKKAKTSAVDQISDRVLTDEPEGDDSK